MAQIVMQTKQNNVHEISGEHQMKCSTKLQSSKPQKIIINNIIEIVKLQLSKRQIQAFPRFLFHAASNLTLTFTFQMLYLYVSCCLTVKLP